MQVCCILCCLNNALTPPNSGCRAIIFVFAAPPESLVSAFVKRAFSHSHLVHMYAIRFSFFYRIRLRYHSFIRKSESLLVIWMPKTSSNEIPIWIWNGFTIYSRLWFNFDFIFLFSLLSSCHRLRWLRHRCSMLSYVLDLCIWNANERNFFSYIYSSEIQLYRVGMCKEKSSNKNTNRNDWATLQLYLCLIYIVDFRTILSHSRTIFSQ